MDKGLIDKIDGSLRGLAVADGLGYQCEYLGVREIVKKFGSRGVTDFSDESYQRTEKDGRKIYLHSDDTQMNNATARALVRASNEPFSIDNVMKYVVEEYLKWFNDQENNRLPGVTCMTGCSNLEKGYLWRESGVVDSKGNGAAMRTSPIGLFYRTDLDKLIDVSIAASQCTHAHPTGITAGVVSAYLTNLALKGEDPNTYVEKTRDLLGKLEDRGINTSEFSEKIKLVEPFKKYKSQPEIAMNRLGISYLGNTGEEAVAMALYAFLNSPNDYVKTVHLAVNIDGDSDTVGAIAGAISGAYNGIQAIPERWRESIENRNLMVNLAGQIAEKGL